MIGVVLARTENCRGRTWFHFHELCPYSLFSYNSHAQGSTKFSPYYILNAREPALPMDRVMGIARGPEDINSTTYVKRITARLHDVQIMAKANLEKANEKAALTRMDSEVINSQVSRQVL